MKSSRYSNHYVLFLRHLREARLEAGLSQLQLADALGQRQTYVSKCELGDRRLDVIEVRDWVIALGGDLEAFMAGLEDRLSRNAKLPVAAVRRSGKGANSKTG
jgi:transcriptional regulator with XRE-family HTH domain